jgi:hypothetical protein
MALINYIDIDWPDLFKSIPNLKTDIFNRIRINREIIPIIFVPGIMGSRLKNNKTGESVWDPDRQIMCMLKKYGGWWNTPAQRKRMLIGEAFNSDFLEVDEQDKRHNKIFRYLIDPRREDRGWGGVFWGAYGKFLEELQYHRWDKPMKSAQNGNNKVHIGSCFEFPVHAFGYNWTDSNFESGRKLSLKVDEIVDKYKSSGRLCKYVILVSHSMGGLVCRSACKLHGADSKVLGVVHGVQPVTGSPAAYWRMKAGFERTGGGVAKSTKSKASAWVLGTNGEEVTCILGNAPGGLELLPNKYYKDNNGESGWLHVPGKEGKMTVFPRHGDPYKEIYEIESSDNGNVFWRLINPDWLVPREKLKPPTNPYNDPDTSWNTYIECLQKVKIFHRSLNTVCHQHTYQFSSSGVDTVDN